MYCLIPPENHFKFGVSFWRFRSGLEIEILGVLGGGRKNRKAVVDSVLFVNRDCMSAPRSRRESSRQAAPVAWHVRGDGG